MRRTWSSRTRCAALLLALAVVGGSWSAAVAQSSLGTVTIEWDANLTDIDLESYWLYYHTDPNIFSLDPNQARTIVTPVKILPPATSHTVPGLDPNRIWHFAVTCRDLSGNESVFSNVVSATPSAVPVVRSVTPSSAEQGATSLPTTLSGSGFSPSSVVDFGPGITVTALDTLGVPNVLVATIDVDPTARTSSRDVTVRNPGGALGTKPSGFLVTIDVDRVDIDGSGRIDNGDFVEILLGYPSAVGDPRYSTDRDLDGDGLVDGADLAILFSYFGLVAPFP